jgi:hypothetical protein
MEATLRVIDERWGSTEGYLTSIGVTEEQINALRDLMLEG